MDRAGDRKDKLASLLADIGFGESFSMLDYGGATSIIPVEDKVLKMTFR